MLKCIQKSKTGMNKVLVNLSFDNAEGEALDKRIERKYALQSKKNRST